jgi:uncharacterized protein YpmB
MRKKLCKIVIVVIVFVSILLSLTTLTEANQTDEKRKKKSVQDIYRQNTSNQVCCVTYLYNFFFCIAGNARQLKNVTIYNLHLPDLFHS